MLKSLLVSLGMSGFSLVLIALLAKCCDELCFQLIAVKIGIVIIYVLVGYIGGKFVKWADICPRIMPLILYLGQLYLLGFLIDGHEGDTPAKTCITYVIIGISYALAIIK